MHPVFQTEFEEYLYQYSPIKKRDSISIRVLEDLAVSYVARQPGCSLRSCIWDTVPMVVSVYWDEPTLESLVEWSRSFQRHGQPVPLLDISPTED